MSRSKSREWYDDDGSILLLHFIQTEEAEESKIGTR